jgi:hypothetical protein
MIAKNVGQYCSYILSTMAPASECVRVIVRCRPLNSKELADGRQTIVEVDQKAAQVVLRAPSGGGDAPKPFTFDAAFDPGASQREVYENTALAIVNSVLSGYNGTIFAYGQTGTGKTHTMEGAAGPPPAAAADAAPADSAAAASSSQQQGIIPNAFEHIFSAIQGSENKQYLVRASYLEIYNEEIRDLLSKNPKDKLELKEHKDSGVYVKGLNAFVVKSVPEIRNVLEVSGPTRCSWRRRRPAPAVHGRQVDRV